MHHTPSSTRSRRAALLCALALGLVGMTGCGQTPQPSLPPAAAPETSGTPAPSTLATESAGPTSTTTSGSASPSPGDTAAPTTTADEFDRDANGYPVLPAAAKENTKSGAEAFARWYLDLISASTAHPQKGVVAAHALPSCKSCANHERANLAMISKGQRLKERSWTVGRTVLVDEFPEWVTSNVEVTQGKAEIVDEAGSVVDTVPAGEEVLALRASWNNGRWKAAEIQVQRGLD